jgi:chromosomal replication initiator protein
VRGQIKEADVTGKVQSETVAGAGLSAAELNEGWGRVAQRLRAELGDDLYTSWFGRMEADSLSGGQLTVSVPTRFLKSWIENHYLARLRKVAAAEFGAVQAVTLRVRNQNGAAAPSPAVTLPRARQVPTPKDSLGLQQASTFAPKLQDGLQESSLDEQLSFDSFKVGQSNQLAHAAALRVANSQAGSPVTFNPLFIHAGAGLGKTHLLNAVAQRIRASQPQRKVMMLTAERFMYGFIHAVRQRDTLSFKDQFQSIDVLLIDDFQFLQGRAIQQEFCHSFNSLVDQRRQVVVAADVPPSAWPSSRHAIRERSFRRRSSISSLIRCRVLGASSKGR